MNRLLSIASVTIPGRVGLAATHVSSRFGIAIESHALLVIDAAVRVEPNYGITRAVPLGFAFG